MKTIENILKGFEIIKVQNFQGWDEEQTCSFSLYLQDIDPDYELAQNEQFGSFDDLAEFSESELAEFVLSKRAKVSYPTLGENAYKIYYVDTFLND